MALNIVYRAKLHDAALNFKAVFEVFYLALVRIFIINE